jgi:hypothetical protein
MSICLVRHFLNLAKLSGLPIMSATAHTDGGDSHSSPPCYSPTLSARSGPDPLEGYSYSSHNGRQTGENPCGLLSPSRPLLGTDLTVCFGGGLPVLMAGDFNAKHVD